MNATLRSTSERATRPGDIHSYSQLQEQIHRDLLAQHPEWIQPNGDCPTCEDYDRRLAELISLFQSGNLNSVQHAA